MFCSDVLKVMLAQFFNSYNFNVSEKEMKVIAFRGKFTVHPQIAVDKIFEQASRFTFLGCDICYDNDDKNKRN